MKLSVQSFSKVLLAYWFIKHHYCLEIKVPEANKVTVKMEIKWKPIKGKLDITDGQG